jgi:hypothetical protein
MWLTSSREYIPQGIDDRRLPSTAWTSDVLKMLTGGVRSGNILVQEPAHKLKCHALQIVERIVGGGKKSQLHESSGRANTNKHSRTSYGRVFQLSRNGNVRVTLPNKQVVDVGVTNRGCPTLETALYLIERPEMQYVLGLCRRLNVFCRRNWTLRQEAILTIANLLIEIVMTLDERPALFCRVLLAKVSDQVLQD